MKNHGNTGMLTGAMVIALALAWFSIETCPGEGFEDDWGSNVKIRADFHTNGNVKTQISAGRAMIPSEGSEIKGEDVKGEIFLEDGSRDILIEMEECFYNRDTKALMSDSLVRMTKQDQMILTGTGLRWDAEQEIMTLLSDVTLVVNSGPKGTFDVEKDLLKISGDKD